MTRTDDIDTSPEAVEEPPLNDLIASWATVPHREVVKQAAALLRQLAKEKAEARNAALREAAGVAEDWSEWAKHGTCSAAILALITPKQDEPTTT